jgi:osmotically-inducible protein OsmY
MKSHQVLSAVASAILLSDSLCGCVGFGKCGTEGCSKDDQITRSIQARMKQHPDLAPADEVGVQTLDGTVYLSGSVLTAMQRDTAKTLARQTLGVNRVVDNIFVIADAGR